MIPNDDFRENKIIHLIYWYYLNSMVLIRLISELLQIHSKCVNVCAIVTRPMSIQVNQRFLLEMAAAARE